MDVTFITSLAEISSKEWNALVDNDNPFIEYEFLSLLETSGSVGPETGWEPTHLLVWDDDRLVGAAPTYLKSHSYGEYIFDWAWADIAAQLRIEYYPKIVVAVPFTPATGPRLLCHPEACREEVWLALHKGLRELVKETDSSSAHILFCTEEEARFFDTMGLTRRATHQFHWRNNDYACFDDFLSSLRSQPRKQIRRERRRIAEAGVEVQMLQGDQVSQEDWQILYELYLATGMRKWGTPYLMEPFFTCAREELGHRAVVGLARQEGEVIAGTLSFAKGKHLYGRYWGSSKFIEGLHFELCYYQHIAWAIERGYTLVEAGAQGEHKLKRGYLPCITHSAHLMGHPILAAAFETLIRQEFFSVQRQIKEAQSLGPFRAKQI